MESQKRSWKGTLAPGTETSVVYMNAAESAKASAHILLQLSCPRRQVQLCNPSLPFPSTLSEAISACPCWNATRMPASSALLCSCCFEA
eukprot:1160218-Pelagomonas_calceolata.AAC.24